jgi:glycosyltransferase involved in cell wall biosynthesis
VTRSALAELYRRATVVAVPSAAEGFGLPVAEALACGSVVLASDLPSLREVGGDAAVYCAVGDVPAWASTLGAVLDGTLAVPGREARLRQGGRYTWTSHAESIALAYRRLCG